MANILDILRMQPATKADPFMIKQGVPAVDLKEYAMNVNSLMPVSGDIQSGVMAAQDLQKGNYGSAALNSLGLLPFIPSLGAITAYHGTPYKFDKFDPAKIGTGEGAQSYGHGLYFAEAPVVANEYKNRLSKNILFTPKGEPFDPFYKLNNINVKATFNKTNSLDDSILRAKELMNSLSPDTQGYQLAKQDLQTLSKLKQSGGLTESSGNLYKVDISDEAVPKMLNWDKPINEQSDEVKKAILPIVKSYGLLGSEKGSSVYQATKELLGQESKLMNKRDALFNKYQKEGMSLSDTVKSMSPEDKKSFSSIAKKIANLKDTPQMASNYLQKRGVTGIKYLDQGSRDVGKGTSNYVVFDPNTIKILERNGLLFE